MLKRQSAATAPRKAGTWKVDKYVVLALLAIIILCVNLATVEGPFSIDENLSEKDAASQNPGQTPTCY